MMSEAISDNSAPPSSQRADATQDGGVELPEVRVAPERVTEIGGETVGKIHCDNPFMVARNVDVYYGENHAIQNVSLEIGKKEVIALIGPSGCGKSTFLRCLNRMNDTIETARVTGQITLDGKDIYLSLIHI